MGYGVFGKLPQKRDFVSHHLPASVLHPWETWLQAAVAASRNELSDQWQDYYLVAPIWRFWLGEKVLGRTCMGAVMASVDQVGRYFPLSVLYVAEPGEMPPPPAIELAADWFAALEARLLDVLPEDAAVDPALLAEGLAPPPGLDPADIGAMVMKGGIELPLAPAGESPAELLRTDYVHAVQARTYWWMNGTSALPARLVGWTGLPDPYFFSQMLGYPRQSSGQPAQ